MRSQTNATSLLHPGSRWSRRARPSTRTRPAPTARVKYRSIVGGRGRAVEPAGAASVKCHDLTDMGSTRRSHKGVFVNARAGHGCHRVAGKQVGRVRHMITTRCSSARAAPTDWRRRRRLPTQRPGPLMWSWFGRAKFPPRSTTVGLGATRGTRSASAVLPQGRWSPMQERWAAFYCDARRVSERVHGFPMALMRCGCCFEGFLPRSPAPKKMRCRRPTRGGDSRTLAHAEVLSPTHGHHTPDRVAR
jgi:hypothetical protein